MIGIRLDGSLVQIPNLLNRRITQIMRQAGMNLGGVQEWMQT